MSEITEAQALKNINQAVAEYIEIMSNGRLSTLILPGLTLSTLTLTPTASNEELLEALRGVMRAGFLDEYPNGFQCHEMVERLYSSRGVSVSAHRVGKVLRGLGFAKKTVCVDNQANSRFDSPNHRKYYGDVK